MTIPLELRCKLDDGRPKVHLPAWEALRRFLRRSEAATLRTLGGDRDSGIREEVAEAWAARGGRVAVDALIDLLGDKEECVRNAAAEGLIRCPSRRAVGPLARLLRDRSMVVRCSAAEALGGTRSKKAALALRRALGDRDPVVRTYIMGSLAELRDRGSLGLLRKIHRDGSARDKLGSAVALYVLGEKSRLEEVGSYLSSPELGTVASEALAWMARGRDIRRAERLLRDALRTKPVAAGWFRSALRSLRARLVPS